MGGKKPSNISLIYRKNFGCDKKKTRLKEKKNLKPTIDGEDQRHTGKLESNPYNNTTRKPKKRGREY